MRVVSFKVDEDLLWLAQERARREGITFSELMRRALKFYLYHNPSERRIIATRKIKIYL